MADKFSPKEYYFNDSGTWVGGNVTNSHIAVNNCPPEELAKFVSAMNHQNVHLENIVQNIAKKKGISVKSLRAILLKLGEQYVPKKDIVIRLDAAADELVKLRDNLKELANDGPAGLFLQVQVSSLIEKGELRTARETLDEGIRTIAAYQNLAPFERGVEEADEYWIPLSDLMTGLMMIFMLVAITFMTKVQEEIKKAKTQQFKSDKAAAFAQEQIDKTREIIILYRYLKNDLYNRLSREFSADLPKWRADLDRDLTIRFRDPESLFENNSATLRPRFRMILQDFLPRYLRILYSEEYRDLVEEIRVEGHTSSGWSSSVTPDVAYLLNMGLSQARTRSVLELVLTLAPTSAEHQWLVGHLTANGLSSSKPRLNTDGSENTEASRRVEFRVRTDADGPLSHVLDPPADINGSSLKTR